MLKIWGRVNSINVQKVMWCVGELGLPHEREDAGGAFGKVDEDWYLEMNPNARVPTIRDGGFVLWESNAIVRYLAAKHDAGGLCPEDPQTRALANQWMDWQQTMLQQALTPVFWGLVRTPPAERDTAAIEAGTAECGRLFRILDAHLAGRRFALGERLTMADIPLGAAAYRWYGLPVEQPHHPNLRAYYERLTERKPFRDHVMIPLT